MIFREDEWALCFTGGDYGAGVRLVRIAQNVHDGATTCLVHMGPFTTKYSLSSLHKLPSSMKKLIPKDKPGKIKTTI